MNIHNKRKEMRKHKQVFNLNRSLSDYIWKNCTHSLGRPTPFGLVCKTCAIAWALEWKTNESIPKPMEKKDDCDPKARNVQTVSLSQDGTIPNVG